MRSRLLLLLVLLAEPALGQGGVGGIAAKAFPRQVTVANLPAADGAQGIRIVTDGASATDCSSGGGSTPVTCFDVGSWKALPDVDTAGTATSGDSATAFFPAGTIEHERGGLEADVSAYGGLVRIAAGSTSAVSTLAGLNTALGSSVADGAHTVDSGNCNDAGVACLFAASTSEGGPATTATALAANGANCSAGQWAAGVDASGVAEGCTADDTGTDTLDDLSDNSVGDTSDVDLTGVLTGHIMLWSGTGLVVSDADMPGMLIGNAAVAGGVYVTYPPRHHIGSDYVSGGSFSGVGISMNYSNAATATSQQNALIVQSYTPAANGQNANTSRGLMAACEWAGSGTTVHCQGARLSSHPTGGTVTSAIGGLGAAFPGGATVTNAIGLRGQCGATAGTTTNCVAINATSSTQDVGVTNRVGVHIDNSTGIAPNNYEVFRGGAITSGPGGIWGDYQVSTRPNYFGGSLHVDGYFRPDNSATPPVACDASVAGAEYYDIDVEAKCYCKASTGWVRAADETTGCS